MDTSTKLEIGVGVAGLVLAAYTIFGKSSGGSSSSSSSGGGAPISSSALTSQVNAYNADAASVATNLASVSAQVEETGIGAGSSAISSYLAAGENQLSTIENATLAESQVSAQEYESQLNALTSSYESQNQTAGNAYAAYVAGATSEANTAVNATATTNIAALESTAQEYETSLTTQLERDVSNNQVTQQKIASTPSFGSVLGSIFSGLGNLAGGLGSSGLFNFGSGGNSGSTYGAEFGNAPAQGQPGSPFFGATTTAPTAPATLSGEPTYAGTYA